MTTAIRKLSADTIRKLLKSDGGEKEEMSTAYKERWPGDNNLVKLAKAVDKDAEFVVFRNGSRFTITYLDTDLIRINPSVGFAPMGFFTRKSLQEAKRTQIDLDDDGSN